MKRVAQIFGNFGLVSHSYLTAWANALACDELHFRQFTSEGKTSTLESAVPILSLSISRREKTARLFPPPKDFISWVANNMHISLRRKLSLWIGFAPLLTYRPTIIHLVNSYIYEKFEEILSILQSEVVVSFRGEDIYIRPLANPDWMRTLLKIFDKANYLHFVSNDLRVSAIKLGAPEEKCVVIYPGIDVNLFRRDIEAPQHRNKEPVQLVTVGRLTWEKGYVSALRAIRILLDGGHKIHYKIIGSGTDLARIYFWIRKLSLQENVTIMGALVPEQVRGTLNNSDIYIQPSLSESFGVAVVEAQAMELPVVCTNVGGLPEIVENGITGILVSTGDDQALAAAISILVKDPAKRQCMGKAGRQKVENIFSLAIETRKWCSLYGMGKVVKHHSLSDAEK